MTDAKLKRKYNDRLGWRSKLERAIWNAVRILFFASTPSLGFRAWRRQLLRMFGARIGQGCRIEPSCRIWLPRNLIMGNYSCLGPDVDCYNVAPVVMGDYVTVSQRSFICTASHDTSYLYLPLITAPITLQNHVWICAEAFVAPGVHAGTGSVLGARSVALKDMPEWTINAGMPARPKGHRSILQEDRAAEERRKND